MSTSSQHIGANDLDKLPVFPDAVRAFRDICMESALVVRVEMLVGSCCRIVLNASVRSL